MQKRNLQDLIPEMHFIVSFIEGVTAISFETSLSKILEVDDDLEANYAMHDRMYDIIRLKVGERLHMFFNRDSEDSGGYIKRIDLLNN